MKLLFIILSLFLSTSLFAGQGNNCRSEVKDICGDFQGDQEQMQQCISENKESFSEACQDRVGQGRRGDDGQNQGEGRGRGLKMGQDRE